MWDTDNAMAGRPGPIRVTAPDGAEWRVERRWMTRRFRRPPRRPQELAESLASVGFDSSAVGSVDSGTGLVVVLVTLLAALILIPLLFFGVELLGVGVLCAAGLIGRAVFRQPWVIEATVVGALGGERRLEWRVRGWRRSQRLIATVVSDLSAGREPPPDLAEPTGGRDDG